MTALVVEGVSLLDLEALEDAKCAGCESPAVAAYSHSGKCVTNLCANHTDLVRQVIARAKAGLAKIRCINCGLDPLNPNDITVRPI